MEVETSIQSVELWDAAKFQPETGASGEVFGDALGGMPAAAAAAQMAMVVGQVCGLMTASPAHRHWQITVTVTETIALC